MGDNAAQQRLNRRSIQEFRIDFLLEEEFACDPAFTLRFTQQCGLECTSVAVESIEMEPNLGGSGYGDLLVIVKVLLESGDTRKLALLIEDKISASAQPRQAERYRDFGESGLVAQWDEYRTVLVAPKAYGGEKEKFDAFIPFETICEWICKDEPVRAKFRKDKIQEAITKKSLSGLQKLDPAMTAFRAAYYSYVLEHNVQHGTDFECVLPRPAYDGDTWLIIDSKSLPKKSRFRHRLATSLRDATGMVEVAFHNTDISKTGGLKALLDHDMRLIANGKHHQHVAVELNVPEIRNPSSFAHEKEKVKQAMAGIERLWQLFRSNRAEIESILAAARLKLD